MNARRSRGWSLVEMNEKRKWGSCWSVTWDWKLSGKSSFLVWWEEAYVLCDLLQMFFVTEVTWPVTILAEKQVLASVSRDLKENLKTGHCRTTWPRAVVDQLIIRRNSVKLSLKVSSTLRDWSCVLVSFYRVHLSPTSRGHVAFLLPSFASWSTLTANHVNSRNLHQANLHRYVTVLFLSAQFSKNFFRVFTFEFGFFVMVIFSQQVFRSIRN